MQGVSVVQQNARIFSAKIATELAERFASFFNTLHFS